LRAVVEAAKPGQLIAELCAFGDNAIEEGLSGVFNRGQVEKGVAFPTTVSVNHIAAYYSPLPEESLTLEEGDVVKINMGVHIDGFIADAATTFILGATAENPASGKKADVILAAKQAIDAAVRKIRVGETNLTLTETIARVAAAYGVNSVEGVLSHQLKQHVIDGNKTILGKETNEQYVEETPFEANEVYDIDVFMSTGEGKPKEGEFRVTVYKRSLDTTYSLKLKTSRAFFSEVNRRYPTLMFSLRGFADQKGARLGVAECLKHNMLQSFPVLVERVGEFVAQFKYTVQIYPNGINVTTSVPFDEAAYTTDKVLPDDLKALLTEQIQRPRGSEPQSDAPKKKQRSRKKKAAPAETES